MWCGNTYTQVYILSKIRVHLQLIGELGGRLVVFSDTVPPLALATGSTPSPQINVKMEENWPWSWIVCVPVCTCVHHIWLISISCLIQLEHGTAQHGEHCNLVNWLASLITSTGQLERLLLNPIIPYLSLSLSLNNICRISTWSLSKIRLLPRSKSNGNLNTIWIYLRSSWHPGYEHWLIWHWQLWLILWSESSKILMTRPSEVNTNEQCLRNMSNFLNLPVRKCSKGKNNNANKWDDRLRRHRPEFTYECSYLHSTRWILTITPYDDDPLPVKFSSLDLGK